MNRKKTKGKRGRGKEDEEEEEEEEEIEELGPPKLITSAGKETSSKPSPPTDAVGYDGQMVGEDAEEGKMLPAIAVAAISNGVGKKGPSSPGEGPSPSDDVQRPSSTDAVEESAPTDEEEKDGEKELSSQLSKKTAAVKEAIE